MSRRKQILYSDTNRLKGEYLDDKTCEILEALIHLSDNNGVVSDIKNIIYDIPDSPDFPDGDVVSEILAAGPGGEQIVMDMHGWEDWPLGELRDYQTVGVAHLYYAKRVVFGESVGLGKTVQLAGVVNLLRQEAKNEGRPFRYLFLTEDISNLQVRREMVRFTGEYVGYCAGTKDYGERLLSGEFEEQSLTAPHSLLHQPLFIDYVRMKRQELGRNPFDLIMVDESAVLGNTANQRYKSALEVSKDISNIYIANATAFESALRIFYAQIHFTDQTFLPTKTEFQKTYEQTAFNGMYSEFNGKYKNQNQFRDLVRYRYLARTRKDLGAKFENCTADTRVVPLSNEQRHLLQRTSMPQMVFDCPWYLDPSLPISDDVCAKLGETADLLETDFDEEARVLIYCHYKEAQAGLYKYLTEDGHSCEIINGDMSQEEKQDIIDDFKSGMFRVLITNVQKGLNFGNTNASIFYSFPSNTNAAVQFEGRTTRDFDIYNKHVRVLLTEGREYDRFWNDLKDRALASEAFAGSDHSMVLTLLLEDED